MELKTTVSFALREINMFGHIYFDMSIKFKEPGKLFRTNLEDTIFSNSNIDNEKFYEQCLEFIKDEKKIEDTVYRWIYEEFSRSEKYMAATNKKKELQKEIKNIKLKIDVKL